MSQTRSSVVWIAPGCPAEIEHMIRADAALRGDVVMPHKTMTLNRLAADQKTVAERKWRAPAKPSRPQAPCDIGLFSDEADQLDLVEMFQDSTEEDCP
jgi:hypothetical protein